MSKFLDKIPTLAELQDILQKYGAIPGPPGRDGLDGRTGDQGATGVAGCEGPQGKPGVEGARGKEGPIGRSGRDGKDGLNGCDGRHGKDGDRGYPGQDGCEGPRGYPGKDGATGEPGRDGKDGEQGADGADGTIVTCVPTGVGVNILLDGVVSCALQNGIDGEKGEKGEDGADGPAGAKGEQGEKGDKGDKGDTGLQGIQGQTGAAGVGTAGQAGADGFSPTIACTGNGGAGTEADPFSSVTFTITNESGQEVKTVSTAGNQASATTLTGLSLNKTATGLSTVATLSDNSTIPSNVCTWDDIVDNLDLSGTGMNGADGMDGADGADGADGTSITGVTCSVANPNTASARLDIVFQSTDGDLPVSIEGSKLWSAISSFAGTGGGNGSIVSMATDIQDGCPEFTYNELTIDGTTYQLPTYNPECCKSYCVTTIDDNEQLIVDIDVPSGYEITFEEGGLPQTFTGNGTAIYTYSNPGTYSVTLCLNNKCETPTTFEMTGIPLERIKTDCGC